VPAWGPRRLAWYVCPTYKQGKRISWKSLKEMTQPYWAGKPSETDLRIELISGGTICIRGADNYDSLRGDSLDFLVLDEYASIAPKAWTEVLRPALADKQGRALFIGTPQGHNHFHELVERAATLPDWKAFQFTTAQGGNVTLEELESAAQELDERTYRQEFLASFETLGVGRASYAFDSAQNVRRLGFDGRASLSWTLDFKYESVLFGVGSGWQQYGVCAGGNDPAGLEYTCGLRGVAPPYPEAGVRNALNIRVYGDATAEQRRTSASRTDWQIVKEFFGRYKDRYCASFHVPGVNPPVKDPINCVNAKLRNHARAEPAARGSEL